MGTLVRIAVALLLALSAGDVGAAAFAVASGSWKAATGVWNDDGCGQASDATGEPSGEVWTICAGVTVALTDADSNASLGTGTIDGTLNVTTTSAATSESALQIADNTNIDVSATGTLNVDGWLISCTTGGSTCNIADQSGTVISTDQFVDWTSTATTVSICEGTGCTSDDATDPYSNIIDADILGFFDIDGDPGNDSPLMTRRPFFHIGSVTTGSDLITIIDTVGTGTVIVASDGINLSAGAGGGWTIPVPISDSDCWSGTSGACTEIDFRSILVPAGTLAYDGDLVGQFVQLNTAGTNDFRYQIISTREDDKTISAVLYDRIIVDRHLYGPDFGQGTIGGSGVAVVTNWDVGGGTENTLANGAKEFFAFRPSQILCGGDGCEINVASGGTLSLDLALLGPLESVANTAPKIDDNGGTVTIRYSWLAGPDGDGSVGNCDAAALDAASGSTVSLTHFVVSHDFEDKDCGTQADSTTNSVPGVKLNAGSTLADGASIHCYNLGYVCLDTNLDTDIHISELTGLAGAVDDGSAGYMGRFDGDGNITIDNAFQAFWPGAGTRTGAGTGSFNMNNCASGAYPCGNKTRLNNMIFWPMTDGNPVNIFANDDVSEDNYEIHNGWIFDYRAAPAVSTDTFRNVWSVTNTTCWYCEYGSTIGETYANNLAYGYTGGVPADLHHVTFTANGSVARNYRFENNLLVNTQPTTGYNMVFGAGGDGSGVSAPAGSTMKIRYNELVNTLGSIGALYSMHISDGFGDVAGDFELTGNTIIGYRGIMNCDAGAWSIASPPLYNIVDFGDGATNANTMVATGCMTSSAQAPYYKSNGFVANPLSYFISPGLLFADSGLHRYGAQFQAGAQPTDWFESAGLNVRSSGPLSWGGKTRPSITRP